MDPIAHPIKLGRKRSTRPVKLKLGNYLDTKAILPKVPAVFGVYDRVQSWQMYKNDDLSDCVIAGAQHEHDLSMAVVHGRTSPCFNDNTSIKNYEVIGGYVPGQPDTDEGCDMVTAADYRKRHGIIDRNGLLHKIDAYVELDRGDWDQLIVAMYGFSPFVGLGMNFFDYNETQFRNHLPWDSQPRGKNEGGHYIPGMGRGASKNIVVVTWGRLQEITERFYRDHIDEAMAYFANEWLLKSGKTIYGFDKQALLTDLEALSSSNVVALNQGNDADDDMA